MLCSRCHRFCKQSRFIKWMWVCCRWNTYTVALANFRMSTLWESKDMSFTKIFTFTTDALHFLSTILSSSRKLCFRIRQQLQLELEKIGTYICSCRCRFYLLMTNGGFRTTGLAPFYEYFSVDIMFGAFTYKCKNGEHSFIKWCLHARTCIAYMYHIHVCDTCYNYVYTCVPVSIFWKYTWKLLQSTEAPYSQSQRVLLRGTAMMS